MSRTRARHNLDHSGCARNGALPEDLYAYAEVRPLPRIGRPPKCDPRRWTVTDDWPDPLPVTEAEIDLFEAWFGDLFDELFGPSR